MLLSHVVLELDDQQRVQMMDQYVTDLNHQIICTQLPDDGIKE